MQSQEELPVREILGQPVSRVHREGGLAYPCHSVDRMNTYDPATGCQIINRGKEPGELSLTAGEAGDITRQRPGRRSAEASRLSACPDGQYLLGWDPSACGRHEQLSRGLV